MTHLLLIDDDEDFCDVAALVLKQAGFQVTIALCPATAFQLLEVTTYDLILCDLHMPFSTGTEKDLFVTSYEVGYRTAKELADIFGPRSVIVLSHLPYSELRRLAPYCRSIPLFSKPSRIQELVSLVQGFIGQEVTMTAMLQ
jgi:CheY-like chemotaxis protein